MTTEMTLIRTDTGSFAPVRILDGHLPARGTDKPTHMDLWDAIEAHAAGEFSAWVEGRAVQALAEMRALGDALGLPRVWAEWRDDVLVEAPDDASYQDAYEWTEVRRIPGDGNPALAAAVAERQGWKPNRDDYGDHGPIDRWLQRVEQRMRQSRLGRWLAERFTPVKEEQ